MRQIDKEIAARNAADEIDALLAQRLTPSAYLEQTPAIQEMAAIISKHFPSAVPVEEQNHEFAFDQRCYYCRNKCCHGADAHAAAISEHG